MQGFYRELGRRVQSARRKPLGGLTQAQLAQRVGLTRSSIANIEQGRQQPPVHVLVKIAEALRLAPGDLLPPIGETDRDEVVRALQRRGLKPEETDRTISLLLGSKEDDEIDQS